MPQLDFWYEFASTYSYLAAMRIEKLAKEAGVEVAWRPFLLGPIFKTQGWADSPFNLYAAKGRYMWRDLKRSSELLGLPKFAAPKKFPVNSLLAARAALALDGAARPEFSRRIYAAEFAEAKDIADSAVIAGILNALGHDAESVLAKAAAQETKDRLRVNTAEAEQLGIFGAPSFVTKDGELFWGNDRLEQALAWAKRV